jgi:hypothetical protein
MWASQFAWEPLQHSNKFVEIEHATIVRQTPVIKGDSAVSWQTTHLAFYFTKSEVKGKNKNLLEMPDSPGQNLSKLYIFTPDPGGKHSEE